jgi:hypothetical protein
MRMVLCYLLGSLFFGHASHNEKNTLSENSIKLSSQNLSANAVGTFLRGFAEIADKKFIGSTLDVQDRKILQRSSPRTVDRIDRGDPLTINDVIKLSQSGADDSNIISYMQGTGSSYHLSQSQVRRLQDAGVSQRVIDFMLDSGR